MTPEDRNGWIIGCFIAYLAGVVIFGIIYYSLYRRRPQRFHFASGLQDAQVHAYKEATARRISALTVENEALEQIRARVEKGATLEDLAEQKTDGSTTDGSFRLYMAQSGSGPGSTRSAMLELTDADGVLLSKVSPPGRWPWQRWDDVFPKRRYKNEMKIALLNARLASLSGSTHDIWSYWDFLYFSTVTQTTLGFGDILPNATSIRLLVVSQVILGYGLLVVLLNLVFRS